MKINAWITAAALAAGVLTSAASIDARAATSQNLSTHGSACRNYNAAEALDIDYFYRGVRNISADARSVICPITTHPVTGPTRSFYVDGSNSGGVTTTCTVYAYSYTGALLSSSSFSTSAATYDYPVSLPTVSFWSFTSMVCTLPGNGNAVIFGAFSVDS
ncbi:hypothetical protein [Lysobacter capsici]|uniref:hypothetical protein n=1 Tax=Lysobacter capsici TaxID=435897 RepID=UPI001BFFE0C4|nr:hypothetical protein [Lysobacter capsici]QWF15081.1 hypothetical protein KME82_14860 [Lysobacter capsici]